MDHVTTALKALAHPERLRILALLSEGELTVSELTRIMGLSQPRVTQYINNLEAAGIIERLREGSWVFSRLRRENAGIAAIVSSSLAALPDENTQLRADLRRLDDIRAQRAEDARAFFADVANDRGQLGDEYLPRERVEAAMRDMVGEADIGALVDLGTGTARVLTLFADRIGSGQGIDTSHDMLRVARHRIEGHGHLSVRQGDLHATPLESGSVDLVSLHQVLHYLDEPREAVAEAARLLRADGRVMIVDFDAHARDDYRQLYSHRRLGFSDEDIRGWTEMAGLSLEEIRCVPATETDRPDVKIWMATKTATETATKAATEITA